MIAEAAKPAKQESISSESESEEEAEYHPNVSVSISHTQIPEEKEEDEEQEKKEDDQNISVPDNASLPAVITPEVEESRKDDTEPEKKHNAEEEEEEECEKETEESTEDPMVTPDEAPNGLPLAEEEVQGLVAHAEEEGEPRMNGEASLVEAEPRPQVICCSEVKSSLGRLRSFPGL